MFRIVVAALLLAAAPALGQVVTADSVVGRGAIAQPGATIAVKYTGWLLENGKRGAKFDSSDDHGGDPIRFVLGSGQVIAGWDQGVQGMRVGGKRTLTIPPELGYGAEGAGDAIPPNATLQFEVELVAVDN